MRGDRSGRIITYKKEPVYFGYSQPLDWSDALNFCDGFRGSVIIPETDNEMRLVQFLAQDLFAAYKKETITKPLKGNDVYNNLWIGIQFKYDRWYASKTGEEIISKYWQDQARANTLNIAKFKIEDGKQKDLLIHTQNKLEFYSTRL